MGTALPKRLLSILYSALILIGLHPATHAQGIVATRALDGHVVYENALPQTVQPQAGEPASVDSGLVYWSNTEHRFKPIPSRNSTSMRAAQSAAEEVRRMIRRAARNDSRLSANGYALQLASEQVQTQPSSDLAHEKSTSASRSTIGGDSAPPSFLDDIVNQVAQRHAVDPNLVRAIIKVESNFNPYARSRKGAIGLMQLMPTTAKSLNVSNPYDPAQNVDAGVRHFKALLNTYNGNLELSLAAYNAGIGAVQKSRGVPRYPETRNYVKRITGIYGSNTARLFTNGHPLEFKRDADGHLTVSNLE
jgi:hypothetical protein